MAEAIDPLEWRGGGLEVPSLNWVKATFSYGFQLRWNNFSRFSFWQWFLNVVGILPFLKKGEALPSSNICLHHLFRARTRVVLKKVFHNSGSFIPFRTHSGKVVESRAVIFWMLGHLLISGLSCFKPLVPWLSSHTSLTATCLLSVPGILAAPSYQSFWQNNTSSWQCHWSPVLQTAMAFESKDILIEEEKIKDDLLLQ